jgi:uncharacterized protein YjaZ
MANSLIDEDAEKLNDSLVNKSDSKKLEQIIHKAELLLGNIGINVDSRNIAFEIVDSLELQRIQPTMQNVVGLTCPISIDGKLHKIWLLENRTYIFLLSVVAHEMGHTWCRDNKLKPSKMEEEGFCELLAFYVLSTQFSKLGNAWKITMMQNPDPIYGDGLRYMKQQLDNCKGSWFKLRAFMKLRNK